MARQYPTYRLGPEFRDKLQRFVDTFLGSGYAAFAKEFANLDDFICRAQQLTDHPEKEIRSTAKEEYLLEVLSFGLYDRLNREAFNRTKDTLIVLPDCVSLNNPACEKTEGEFGDVCQTCTASCESYHVMELAKEYGARVVFSKRKLSQQLEYYAGKMDRVGVIGVACMVMLASGMRTCIDLGIPVRGVLLSFTGCEHWNDQPFGSRFAMSWLKEILEEKYGRRNSSADD